MSNNIRQVTPEQNRRRWQWIFAFIAISLVAVGSLAAVATWRGGTIFGPSDTNQIIRTGTAFAHAADTQDEPTMITLLCREEADRVTSDDDYDPENASAEAGLTTRPFEVNSVQVLGEFGALKFTRSDNSQQGTLYFKKEEGAWKVCDTAKASFE